MTPFIIHPDPTDYNTNVNTVRRDRLLKELTEQGITDYKFFPAIFEDIAYKGIAKAHRQIVQYAKDNNLPEVLIFEDDIQFTHKDSFKRFLELKPDDYDLYLGGIYLGELNGNIVKEFTAMHCYMVHERFYDAFLNADPQNHIDVSLNGLGKYVVCYPMIAIQYNGYSYNSRQECNYDSILAKWEMWKG